MILRWLRNLFSKKAEEPKELITAEQLESRVLWAVQMVVMEGRIPADNYELIDMKCEAMKLFMTDNPWFLRKRDIIIARKRIEKYDWHFKHGRLI